MTGKIMTDLMPMLVDAALILFFLAGIVALAVGMLLLLVPGGFERLSVIMGRRFSVRQSMKPLEVPHYYETFFYRHHRWTGGAILLGAFFFFLSLVFSFELHTAAKAVPGEVWLWSGVLWILIIGNACALIVGALILFRPDALRPLESVANRWISTRQTSRPLDQPHDIVDRFAVTHPHTSGAILAVAGLFLIVTFGLLLAG